MKNSEIAAAFDELGTLYELDGAVIHRVLAYRNAAKAIRDSGKSVAELAAQGRATELAGVGKTIAEKIDALLAEGDIPAAVKLRERIPPGLVAGHPHPGPGPQARASCCTTSWASRRWTSCAGRGRGRAAAHRGRASAPRPRRTCWRRWPRGADGQEKPRTLLSKALEVGEEMVAALREHPAADPRGAGRQRPPLGRDAARTWTSWPAPRTPRR